MGFHGSCFSCHDHIYSLDRNLSFSLTPDDKKFFRIEYIYIYIYIYIATILFDEALDRKKTSKNLILHPQTE